MMQPQRATIRASRREDAPQPAKSGPGNTSGTKPSMASIDRPRRRSATPRRSSESARLSAGDDISNRAKQRSEYKRYGPERRPHQKIPADHHRRLPRRMLCPAESNRPAIQQNHRHRRRQHHRDHHRRPHRDEHSRRGEIGLPRHRHPHHRHHPTARHLHPAGHLPASIDRVSDAWREHGRCDQINAPETALRPEDEMSPMTLIAQRFRPVGVYSTSEKVLCVFAKLNGIGPVDFSVLAFATSASKYSIPSGRQICAKLFVVHVPDRFGDNFNLSRHNAPPPTFFHVEFHLDRHEFRRQNFGHNTGNDFKPRTSRFAAENCQHRIALRGVVRSSRYG